MKSENKVSVARKNLSFQDKVKIKFKNVSYKKVKYFNIFKRLMYSKFKA